ncbi:TPA: hypothetical protein DEO28_04090 [Candidatus Dependentiae bacterium]|nr:MAG: hypothetical protein UR14_C0006G0055 [candidate division TM6 bacterium GW2011_GWE2_31_21]KKP53522.1 MAG: hypothetical protein UR43_C0004G0063 [candidate division TM6 bacterium GW2011_GWF2_33_332]HBS48237.1 hypothetical protein [Candidatus Dependentiae bacterium]HBZ73663.1 hypothetical protein [Candidatus Dependentiae bacterium]
MFKKYLFFLLLFTPNLLCNLGKNPKYLFFQCSTDETIFAPILNLQLLEDMRNVGFSNLNRFEWLTKNEWTEKYSKQTKSWEKFIQDIVTNKKTFKATIDFLENATAKGVVFPHIYDANRKNIFLQKDKSLFLPVSPAFFIDLSVAEKMKNVGGGCLLLNLDTCSAPGISKIIFKNLENKQFALSELGIYKLMLLRLGLSNANTAVAKSDLDFPIFKELERYCNKDRFNLWNAAHFSKDNLFQVQLAKLFEERKDLYKKSKQVVDFYFKPWKTYKQLKKGEFYGKNGEKYDFAEVQKFLPGKHQILAYYFSQQLMLLWFGANCENILKIPGLFRLFKRYAFIKQTIKYQGEDLYLSFVEVWQEVQKALLVQTHRRDFISFNGHGYVISFDEQIIKMQNDVLGVSDFEFLETLNFAIIDSMVSSNLNLFYRDPQTFNLDLLQQIAKVWRNVKDTLPQRKAKV